jgi:hypothetical protein
MTVEDAMELRISHLIEDIACGGVHPETARARVSSYAQNHLICFRPGTNTSPNIYGPLDSAVAVVLSALQDLGIADHEVLHTAALVAYPRMGECLAGLACSESWTLVLETYRHPASGRFITAHLIRQGEPAGQPMPVEMTPRGAVLVVLDEMLSPVVRRLHPPKGAH